MDRAELHAHNARIVDEFRRSAGRVGGDYEHMTLLLLHTRGVRTGLPRINPLVQLPLGDGTYAVFATNGGAANDPDWYRNVLHDPNVIIEVGTQRLAAVARVADGDEHARIWSRQAEAVPYFAQLAATAGRDIPIVVLDTRRAGDPGGHPGRSEASAVTRHRKWSHLA
jgi:deazaflavin-dependent oxidoreductase (nitroreductase family)